MNPISNLLGGLVPSNRSQELGNGGDPQRVNTINGDRVRNHYTLPESVTALDLYRVDEEQQKLVGENEILQHYSDASDALVVAALKNEEIKLKHSEKMMGRDQEFRKLQVGHREAISRYQLGVGRTQAQFNGYQSAYQEAGEIIDIS